MWQVDARMVMENEIARMLKREAVTAKADGGDHEMVTAEKYF
jgi:hypothetical protein